jgi:hypothetical protein
MKHPTSLHGYSKNRAAHGGQLPINSKIHLSNNRLNERHANLTEKPAGFVL